MKWDAFIAQQIEEQKREKDARYWRAETIREYRRTRDSFEEIMGYPLPEPFRAWLNRQARNARDGKPHGGKED